MPFPLIVANVYSVNSRETPLIGVDVSLQNVVYEMSPLEYVVPADTRNSHS